MLFRKEGPLFFKGSQQDHNIDLTHLQVLEISVRGGGPDFLHHGCHKVVGLKLLAAKLFAALWAGDRSLSSSPVPGNAGFAEVVHAGQHNRVPEEITADGTCQILLKAAFGRCWCICSSSHDRGEFPLQSLSTLRK